MSAQCYPGFGLILSLCADEAETYELLVLHPGPDYSLQELHSYIPYRIASPSDVLSGPDVSLRFTNPHYQSLRFPNPHYQSRATDSGYILFHAYHLFIYVNIFDPYRSF